MSILIKGMEMPKSCKECQVSFGYGNDVYCPFLFKENDDVEDGLMWKECTKEGRLADCPLVEVKEPHGRLIDADKLDEFKLPSEKQDFKTWHKHSAEYKNAVPIFNSALDLVKNNAPTVIEAEGSEK